MRLLSEEERVELLAQLQAKWERVNRAYSCLPLVCDTDPAKRRKEAHEAELAQLETDIATLRRGNVLVSTLE